MFETRTYVRDRDAARFSEARSSGDQRAARFDPEDGASQNCAPWRLRLTASSRNGWRYQFEIRTLRGAINPTSELEAVIGVQIALN